MNNKENLSNYTIGIREVVVSLLKKWKVIFFAVVAGAVLMGLLGVVRTSPVSKAPGESEEYQNLEMRKEMLESSISSYKKLLQDGTEKDKKLDAETIYYRAKVYESLKLAEDDLKSITGQLDTIIAEENAGVRSRLRIDYIILGILAGGFISCGVILIWVLFSSKVRNTEQMRGVLGVRILGEVYAPEKSSSFHRKLDALEGIKTQMSPDEENSFIAANVENAAGGGKESIYLTGTCSLEKLEDLKSRLYTFGKFQNREIGYGLNPYYNTLSLRDAARAGGVIIVAERGKSKLPDVEEILTLLEENEVRLLGAVLI